VYYQDEIGNLFVGAVPNYHDAANRVIFPEAPSTPAAIAHATSMTG
jgi:hypothetical protein